MWRWSGFVDSFEFLHCTLLHWLLDLLGRCRGHEAWSFGAVTTLTYQTWLGEKSQRARAGQTCPPCFSGRSFLAAHPGPPWRVASSTALSSCIVRCYIGCWTSLVAVVGTKLGRLAPSLHLPTRLGLERKVRERGPDKHIYVFMAKMHATIPWYMYNQYLYIDVM